jgi:predicted amidohydrolase
METTLAAVNMTVRNDKAANLERIIGFIEEAGDRGVDILVLPEACLQGYIDSAHPLGSPEQIAQRRYFLQEAEALNGSCLALIGRACQRADLYTQVGFIESTASNALLYNSAALIGPDGLRSVYRKCHSGGEYPYFASGNDICCTTINSLTVGSLICYDLAFPETMRIQALRGAVLSLMSTAWPMGGHDREHDYCGSRLPLTAQANAFFNQMWLVISDHCETGAHSTGVDYYGGASIINPMGEEMATLGPKEGMITYTADLDTEVLRSRTESFYGLTLLQDRRPELYPEISTMTS